MRIRSVRVFFKEARIVQERLAEAVRCWMASRMFRLDNRLGVECWFLFAGLGRNALEEHVRYEDSQNSSDMGSNDKYPKPLVISETVDVTKFAGK